MEVFITLLAVSLTLLYGFLRFKLGYWQRRGVVHETPNFPMGNIAGWRSTKHFIDLFQPVYEKFKGKAPFAGFYLMAKPAVLVLDLELVKNILIKDFNNFDERGVFHNPRDDPLTGNLFSLDGNRWRRLRNKLSPTFTSGKMKTMFPTVLRIAEEFARVFEKRLQSETKIGSGDVIEVTDMLSRFTTDVIGNCAFGLECNSMVNAKTEFLVMGRRVLLDRKHSLLIDRFIESFPKMARRLRMVQIHPDITDFYSRIVRETIAYRRDNNVKRNDFMNMLIEMSAKDGVSSEDGLTEDEIIAQAFIFFVAGFETSSSTMGFALYELAQHQDIQDRLRAEVNQMFANNKDVFAYENMKDMPYMDMVISETLRKYPILPHLTRTSRQDYHTKDPRYTIEKGMMVLIPAHSIQHDPEIYPEPEKFIPERFTPEAIKARPACTWLPFGDGPRNCIGLRFGKMQTCVGLTFLLKNFRFSVCDQTPIPLQLVKENILLSSNVGFPLKVVRV